MNWDLFEGGPRAAASFGLAWLCQSSALIAIGLGAGRLLRRSGPAVQSVLYRTTLAAVLACPIASALMARAGFEGLAPRLPAASVVAEAPAVAPRPTPVAPAVVEARSSEIAQETCPRPVEPAPRVTEASVAATPAPISRGDWPRVGLSIALAAWLVGTLAMGLRLAVGFRRMARLRGAAIPADSASEALCRDLAARMRLDAPAVLRAPFLHSPCVDGLRRPAILLPEEPGEDLRATFVHELAHLARRDVHWNLLRQASTALFWFQPLLWVLSRRMEVTAEEVCDDYVVQFGSDRASYATLLLELAGRSLPPASASAVGMVSLRSLLARRIVRILDPSRSPSTRAGARAVAAMLLAGLAGTCLAGLLGIGNTRRAEAAPPAEVAPKPDDSKKPEAADVPIRGRIVDLEGRPVPGVSVTVGTYYTPPTGDLSPWIAAVRKGEPPWVAYPHVGGSQEAPKSAKRSAVTDKDGRFTLEGLGAERLVSLRISGDTIAASDVDVVTRRVDPFDAPGFPSTYGPGSQTIYGAEFTLPARPGRAIEGVVVDSKTREPMAGVLVESSRFSGSDFVGTSTLKATTDARGKFRLVGMPKGAGNILAAIPNDDQPYFQRDVSVGDPPGLGPIPLEIELHRGIWITGKVTDKVTGAPAKNARLHYMPFLENKYVQGYPEFGKDGYNVQGSQMRYQTKPDGSYKLVGLPGRAVVGVDNDGKTSYRAGFGYEDFKKEDLNEHGYLRTWNNPIWAGKKWPLAMKEINPAEGADNVALDLQLDPGQSVRIRVVDPAGQPVEGVSIGNSAHGEVHASGEMVLTNFAPDEKRTVIVRHEGRKLGRVVRVGPGDDSAGPVVVALAPYAKISGRVLDPDGRPLPGALIRPDLKPGGDFAPNLGQVVSDEKGLYEVKDVPIGCGYSLLAESGTMLKDRRVGWVDAEVKPGEATVAADIRFKKD